MEILLLNLSIVLITTVLAIVSIGGETWRSGSSTWIGYLTPRGWISIVLLIVLALVTTAKEFQQNREQELLANEIKDLRRANELIITDREYSLVDIGVTLDFLTEKLGQPALRINDGNLVCAGEFTYARWSDIGRNSIQILANRDGQVVGFSSYSNRIPIKYANTTIEPSDTFDPYDLSNSMGLEIYGDARFFGFAENLGNDSLNFYNTIFIGWGLSRSNAEAIEELASAVLSEDPSASLAKNLSETELRTLAEDTKLPKIAVFSDFGIDKCNASSEKGDEEDPEPTTSDVWSMRAFFSFSSFEAYEWRYLDHRS